MQHDYLHPDGHWTCHTIRYMTREECVETYRRALVEPTPQLRLFDRRAGKWLTAEDARRELAGRDLCCWCKPHEACHVDVLLAVANDTTQEHGPVAAQMVADYSYRR